MRLLLSFLLMLFATLDVSAQSKCYTDTSYGITNDGTITFTRNISTNRDTVKVLVVYIEKMSIKVDSGFVIRVPTLDVKWDGSGRYSPVLKEVAWFVHNKNIESKNIVKIIY